jgi:hypothetical protein
MNTPSQPKNEYVPHWRQWRERCAVARCELEAQAYFFNFARIRLSSILAKQHTNEEFLLLESADPGRAWHLFETKMHANSKKSGTRWKDHFFAQIGMLTAPDATHEHAEGYASNVFRSLTRSLVNNEGSGRIRKATGRSPHPLDAPLASDDPDSSTLESILPDPNVGDTRSEVEYQEILGLAQEIGNRLFEAMPEPERLVLYGCATSISLADPAWDDVKEISERFPGRDKRYELSKGFKPKVQTAVNDQYLELDDTTRIQLINLASVALCEQARVWGDHAPQAQLLREARK